MELPGRNIDIDKVNYFLHRIKGGDNALPLARTLLNKGYLTIGWSDFSDEEYLHKISREPNGINDVYLAEYGYLPRNRWNLWRFICDMKKGDIILVPQPYTFSLYVISDDIVYTNKSFDKELLADDQNVRYSLRDGKFLYDSHGRCTDIGFYRRVSPVPSGQDIPRWEYADAALTSRMKIRQTNSCITDLRTSVDNALERWRDQKPLNLKSQLRSDLVNPVLKLLQTQLNEDKFEALVVQLMKTLGAEIEPHAKNETSTEQGDADCVAIFNDIKVAILIQVKHHTETTESWAVEQIEAFRKNHNYDEYTTAMWVISTCSQYSETAIKMAEDEGVRLIDGEEFASMLLEYGIGYINI